MEQPSANEPSNNEQNIYNAKNSDRNSQVESWAEEKKSLINKIMALKSENQLLVQELNDKNIQLNSANTLKNEIQIRLNEKDSNISAKFDELKMKLQNSDEKATSCMKSVSDLKRANLLLVSQNKQLQTALAQNEEVKSDSDESDFYEVENLLNDKLVSERHYLVRWRGFDQTHDTWERESNLRCTDILKKYKRSKKKH